MKRAVRFIFNYSKANQQGFSLLEVAIVLTIVGIIGGLCLPLLTAQRKYSAFVSTRSNQEYILHAVAAYVQRYGRFPCPADFRKGGTNDGMAQVSCRGQKAIGYIPFKTLGISEVYTKDSNKHPMIYVVEPQLTQRYVNLSDEPGGSITVLRDDGSSVISTSLADEENPNYVVVVLMTLNPNQDDRVEQNFVFREKDGEGGIMHWESRDQFLKHYVGMK